MTAPSAAATAHVEVILPVSALTRRDQRFACVPLHATLSAAACIARQEEIALEMPPTKYRESAYSPCRGCAIGREIAVKIEGKPVKQADPRRTATGPAPSQRMKFARGRAKGAAASQKSAREARAVMAMMAMEAMTPVEEEESAE